MDGFLLIDKPEGWTSHDVVAYLRKITGIRRIGHAGTLDPFATGLLVVGVGSATKNLATVAGLEKEYIATLRFGAVSDTDDRTGKITQLQNPPTVEENQLRETLTSFIGEIEQIPPMYSAKKIGGRKLYELARRGETIERRPARVIIKKIELVEAALPKRAVIKVVCGGGTYIRALAKDIGQALGTGAYLEELRRTRIGPYRVEEAHNPRSLTLRPDLFLPPQ
ncbi:tRNA pseudouridine(55) synthase TruB [Patescibacteria group bacterium]|nr:MAG: tRNA pseudouridine(55) synthase TruB [Patescibacteria group bacterium]